MITIDVWRDEGASHDGKWVVTLRGLPLGVITREEIALGDYGDTLPDALRALAERIEGRMIRMSDERLRSLAPTELGGER